MRAQAAVLGPELLSLRAGRAGREAAHSSPGGVHSEFESQVFLQVRLVSKFVCFSFRNTWDRYVKMALGN